MKGTLYQLDGRKPPKKISHKLGISARTAATHYITPELKIKDLKHCTL